MEEVVVIVYDKNNFLVHGYGVHPQWSMPPLSQWMLKSKYCVGIVKSTIAIGDSDMWLYPNSALLCEKATSPSTE